MMFRNVMRLRSRPPMARVVRVGGKAKPKAKSSPKPKAQIPRPAAGEIARIGGQATFVSTGRMVNHVARSFKSKADAAKAKTRADFAKPLTGG